jgi:hypothetical protein
MNIPHYPHRRVPWDATGRLQARPRGAAHPRARGRGPGISPPWPSAARVASRRPVYRVYSEEEFLAAEEWDVEALPACGSALEPAPEFALLGQASPQFEPRAWGRVAAVAALTTAAAVLVEVVAMNETRSTASTDRRFASRRVVSRAPFEDRLPRSSSTERGSVGGDMRRRQRQPATAIRPLATRRAPIHSRFAVHLSASSPAAKATTTTASVTAATIATAAPATAATASAAATRTATATPASAPTTATTVTSSPTTATTVTSTAAAAPAPVATAAEVAERSTRESAAVGGADSEFGFERR